MVLVAPDKLLVDFGLRRAHSVEAGLLAARASYIAAKAGCPSTFGSSGGLMALSSAGSSVKLPR